MSGRLCFVQDNEGHWYLIDPSLIKYFHEIKNKCEKKDDYEEFEKLFGNDRHNGPHTISFIDPEEI